MTTDHRAAKQILAVGISVLSWASLSCGSTDVSEDTALEPVLDAESLQAVIREQTALFNEAEERLQACLREEGFDYQPATVKVVVTSEHGGLRSLEEQFKTVGYGIVSGEADMGVEAFILPGNVPSAQQESYLKSIYEEGPCSDLLNVVEIHENIRAYQDSLPEISEELAQCIMADQKFIEAQEAWRQCMSDEGYPYDSSIEAFDDIEARQTFLPTGDDRPEARVQLAELERKIASADWDCLTEHTLPVLEEWTES